MEIEDDAFRTLDSLLAVIRQTPYRLYLLIDEYDITFQLADLLYEDPYGVFTEYVERGMDLGEAELDGRSCRHLAFRQESIDWQIWVENSDTPLPRKIIITEKWITGQPQFTAILSNWDVSPDLQDRIFIFDPPKGLLKIDIRS